MPLEGNRHPFGPAARRKQLCSLRGGDEARRYLLPDALDSIRQLIDASARVTLAQSSEPFGNLVEQARMGLFK